jgi:tRNA U55 pseudouridine synthase TruB
MEIIKNVQGDFRQKQILNSWQEFLKNFGDSKCTIAKFEATVTSGIYIRTLSTMFGGYSLAYSIKRLNIGEYKI